MIDIGLTTRRNWWEAAGGKGRKDFRLACRSLEFQFWLSNDAHLGGDGRAPVG